MPLPVLSSWDSRISTAIDERKVIALRSAPVVKLECGGFLPSPLMPSLCNSSHCNIFPYFTFYKSCFADPYL